MPSTTGSSAGRPPKPASALMVMSSVLFVLGFVENPAAAGEIVTRRRKYVDQIVDTRANGTCGVNVSWRDDRHRWAGDLDVFVGPPVLEPFGPWTPDVVNIVTSERH